jgi:hypothetical protein
LLVLSRQGNNFLAQPGPGRIKLLPRLARYFFGEKARGARMNKRTRKLVLPLRPESYQSRPLPLRAIYVLSRPGRASSVRMRALSPRQACVALLRNTFNAAVVEPERQKRLLRHAARVAAQIPVKHLRYPRRLSALPAVRDTILADLAR